MQETKIYLLETELKELRKEFQTFKKIFLPMHDISNMQYLIMKKNAEKETNNDVV